MTLPIDKNITPPSRVRTYRSTRYPWNDMAIGDSFFVPSGDPKRIRCAFSMWKQKASSRSDFFITVRRVDDGVRVWRISEADAGWRGNLRRKKNLTGGEIRS